MDKIILSATRRDITGKKVKVLRNEGKLPAIIYGKDVDSLPILLNLHETTKLLRGASRSSVLTIDVEGEEFTALVRERQRDVLSGQYLHIDFLAISLTETVRTLVNIVLEGESPAVENFEAILISGLDRVEVESLPGDLPENIIVDISMIESIGDGVYVKDLVLSQGVEILENQEDMIVVATSPSLVEEEEVVEEVLDEEFDEDGEPIVIEKGRVEEEEE